MSYPIALDSLWPVFSTFPKTRVCFKIWRKLAESFMSLQASKRTVTSWNMIGWKYNASLNGIFLNYRSEQTDLIGRNSESNWIISIMFSVRIAMSLISERWSKNFSEDSISDPWNSATLLQRFSPSLLIIFDLSSFKVDSSSSSVSTDHRALLTMSLVSFLLLRKISRK